MDEYKKLVEQGKIARSQGVKLARPESIDRPSRNRIEAVLGEKEPFIPPLKKSEVPEREVRVENKESKAISFRKPLLYIVSLGLIAGITFGSYKAYQYFTAPKDLSAEEVLERVARLAELPAGESATVATVTDLEPLRDQPFFADARVGDKVIIYGESRKAILYRPSEDKIIVVAPLNR